MNVIQANKDDNIKQVVKKVKYYDKLCPDKVQMCVSLLLEFMVFCFKN